MGYWRACLFKCSICQLKDVNDSNQAAILLNNGQVEVAAN